MDGAIMTSDQRDAHEIRAKLDKDKIHFNCRFYSGYKPCGKSEFCEGCSQYSPINSRILIIKLAALGDVLRTTSILPGLKKAHPQSHISWITDKNALPLLENNPYIDALYCFDAEGVLIASHKRYDLVLNFEKEERALALMRSTQGREKRGFAFSEADGLSIANDASLYSLQLGLNDELKFYFNRKTYQQIIYEMAELKYSGEGYVLELPEESVRFAEKTGIKKGLEKERYTIGLNTGCGGVFETKRWTIEGFSQLAELLHRDGDCQILLLGGPREEEFNRAILEKTGDYVIDTGCRNPLHEFFGLVSLCDVVVSSDSLGAHIAVALEKQVVVFFGSTCSSEVDLYGRGEKLVTDFSCSPCYKKRCDKEVTCMQALEADAVHKAVRRCISSITPSRT